MYMHTVQAPADKKRRKAAKKNGSELECSGGGGCRGARGAHAGAVRRQQYRLSAGGCRPPPLQGQWGRETVGAASLLRGSADGWPCAFQLQSGGCKETSLMGRFEISWV